MPVEDSESHSRIQIEMAANGCISGTLSEWPHLKHALRKLGYKLRDNESAESVCALCKTIIGITPTHTR